MKREIFASLVLGLLPWAAVTASVEVEGQATARTCSSDNESEQCVLAISCADASAAYASSTAAFYRNVDDAIDRKTGPFVDDGVWIWGQFRNVVLYRRAVAACPDSLFAGCAIFTETQQANIEHMLDGSIPPSEIPALTCRVRRLGVEPRATFRPPERIPKAVISEERPAL